jgi:hypothetical protein
LEVTAWRRSRSVVREEPRARPKGSRRRQRTTWLRRWCG